MRVREYQVGKITVQLPSRLISFAFRELPWNDRRWKVDETRLTRVQMLRNSTRLTCEWNDNNNDDDDDNDSHYEYHMTPTHTHLYLHAFLRRFLLWMIQEGKLSPPLLRYCVLRNVFIASIVHVHVYVIQYDRKGVETREQWMRWVQFKKQKNLTKQRRMS